MKIRDVVRMAWGQIIRRKMVTLLCMIGLSIGSAAMIIALSVGQSVQTYSEKTLNENYKMDEITISPNEGIKTGNGSGGGQTKFERGALTMEKIRIIQRLPHVVAVAPMLKLDMLEMVLPDNRSTYVEVIGTEMQTLNGFGYRYAQGSGAGNGRIAVVNYGATYGFIDPKVTQKLFDQLNADPYNNDLLQQYNEMMGKQDQLMQQRILFRYQDFSNTSKTKMSGSIRVSGELMKPSNLDDMSAQGDKKVYIPLDTARALQDELGLQQADGSALKRLNSALVKVDNKRHVAQVEEQIKKLTLNTQSNLFQEEAMAGQLAMYQKAAIGIGGFIMVLASLSIIVAMIMSTHQRRKQIGVMKVLGANLWQIRQMFIVEAAMLGLMGGIAGVGIAFAALDGVNRLLASQMADQTGGPMTVIIQQSALPLGIVFAVLVGVVSGIYPAISASRTNALSVIKSM
ncbi:ABC transporter permease [Paenibacillus barcinonensis]|uniref:ABC transporter permease n=1 Tax=Paenibacillus barcinonensis TaxID=198119 RepID=A0A2V4VLZ7_PAEBA|nr:ABC transporter permease [Paenibacillus barcinonensis]PYE47181.1 ABC-type antimicrobial peptide transport system permease subunit [Paenibacillus barcinonensis]QKS58653.1 ABC transporter permease [Paenibacillus barcinonensis]